MEENMDFGDIGDEDLVDFVRKLDNNHSGDITMDAEVILAGSEQNVGDSGDNQVGAVHSLDDTSIEKAREYIESMRKPNTVRATNKDIRHIQDWLAGKKFELRNIEDLPPELLAEYLTQYFVFVVKKDGTMYQPSSLTNMMYSVDRYLKEHQYSYVDGNRVSIMKDVLFQEVRSALASRRVDLKRQGLGNRPQRSVAVDLSEEELFWEKGILGKTTAFSLQFSMWYHMTLMMGLRGRDEHRRVSFGDLSLKKDSLNVDYLELADRGAKTRDGAVHNDTRSTSQKIYCTCADTGPDRCVVEIYRELIIRRPSDFCDDQHPFYLQSKTPEQIKRSGTAVWFKREPLGVASLGRFLPKACNMAGITPRGNHGIRATAVQRLRKAKVPDDKIIQLTGHKSVRTLAIYDTDQLYSGEHKEMQSILHGSVSSSRTNAFSSSEASATVSKSPDDLQVSIGRSTPSEVVNIQGLQNQLISNCSGNPKSIFGGAVISNCVFNIHTTSDNVSSSV